MIRDGISDMRLFERQHPRTVKQSQLSSPIKITRKKKSRNEWPTGVSNAYVSELLTQMSTPSKAFKKQELPTVGTNYLQ